MGRIEIIRESAESPGAENTADALLGIHKSLSGENRRELSFLRVNDQNEIEASFKSPCCTIKAGRDSCLLEGETAPKSMDILMGLAAQMGYKDISVKAEEEAAPQLWLKAQDYALNVTNITPDEKTIAALKQEVDRLQPVGEFFAKAEKITLHPGSLSPKKASVGERFLKTVSEKIGKLAKAMKPAARFYNKHKTVMNFGGMGVGFALMGPVGMTLYSQIDKARRAHVEAQRRRSEEKTRMAKIAKFAEKGIKPVKKKKGRGLYKASPYIRFTGHLAVRLAGTIALTAVAGPIVGATASAIITTGKTIYDTRLLQDLALKAVGKKIKDPMPLKDRLHKSIQTAAGVEIEKEKFDKMLKKCSPASWIKGKKKASSR